MEHLRSGLGAGLYRRTGHGACLCHSGAKSGQKSGVRQGRGEGVLAVGGIMGQVWHKVSSDLPPSGPSPRDSQPLSHRLPIKVGSRASEFSVCTSSSSLDINLEQAAREMREKEYIYENKCLPCGLVCPYLYLAFQKPELMFTRRPVRTLGSSNPANPSIHPSRTTFHRYIVDSISLFWSRAIKVDSPVLAPPC